MAKSILAFTRHKLGRMFFIAIVAWQSALSAEPLQVHLELMLAVDSSYSVSDAEFDLQMQGIARAFEHPLILDAIDGLGERGIAVAVIQWSSLQEQAMAVNWMHLANRSDSLALASIVRNAGRLLAGGSTAMSAVMAQAVSSIENNAFSGERRVIDISGDGSANEGISPAVVRDMAIAAGITINGLAILNEEAELADYYRQWVVGGAGHFLMTALDYEDFLEAIRIKLYREIVGPSLVGWPPASGDSEDCWSGQRFQTTTLVCGPMRGG